MKEFPDSVLPTDAEVKENFIKPLTVDNNKLSEMDLSALCAFLVKAKINSYAGDGQRSESKCILSKNYLYIDGNFRYEDQYFGEYLDVGEEIVWHKEIPLWGMGYRGGMFQQYLDLSDRTFSHLRKALMEPEQDFPIRGPYVFKEGRYTYINTPIGDITSFTGSEKIKRDETDIYFRNYLGGLIVGKTNKDVKIISLR